MNPSDVPESGLSSQSRTRALSAKIKPRWGEIVGSDVEDFALSPESARALDIVELTPSDLLSQNEIDAANSVRLDHLNSQGQPKFVWPPTFALARAYVDQLERSRTMASARITSVRQALSDAERASVSARRSALSALAGELGSDAARSGDAAKVRMLADAVQRLAAGD